MYISKKVLVVLMAAFIGFLASGALFADDPQLAQSSTLETILQRGSIVVGSDIPFRPFEFFDADGNLVGFDVDLMQLLADSIGVDLDFTAAGSFDTIRTELNNGDFDIVASDMSATLERAREVNFSAAYLETGQIVMVSSQTSIGSGVQNYSDLNVSGATIAVQTGTTGEGAAQTFFPNATIASFTDAQLALQEVFAGAADAIVFDDVFLIPNFVNPADTFLCCPVVNTPGSIEAIRTQINPISLDQIALAIRKGDPDFLTYIDLFILQIQTVIVVTEELADQFELPASAIGSPILTALQEKWELR